MVTDSEATHEITIGNPALNDKYYAGFVITDIFGKYIKSDATVTVSGHGEQRYPFQCEGCVFTGIAKTESPSFTIKAPGYKTYTGKISLNSDTPAGNIKVFLEPDNTTLGISKTQTSSIGLYSTLADDYIYLTSETPAENGMWKVNIISASGTTVSTGSYKKGNSVPVYTGGLQKGFYLVKVSDNLHQEVFRIIKKQTVVF